MTDHGSDPSKDALLRQRALSRWDNEGGAKHADLEIHSSEDHQATVPKMSESELVALHIRMIALENLVISLLATASDGQLELAREMASYISPRPGFTQHPITTRAADHMTDLVERAERFRDPKN